MDWKTLFFSADGRIGRQSFWIGWLVIFAVNVLLSWIPVIGWILSLVGIYASVCVFSKRLHDMGKSGWLQVYPMVISFVIGVGSVIAMGGPAIMAAATGGPEEAIAGAAMGGIGVGLLGLLVAFLIGIGFTLWVGLSASDPQTNSYGPAASDPAVVL